MSEKKQVGISPAEARPKISYADPAPLGLVGLAVAALVLAAADLGWTSGAAKSLIIPWTVFLGATAQLIAGLIEYRRHNMFGATAFTTYSLLWYSISLILTITIFTRAEFDIKHYAIGLIGFLIFSLFLTVGSLLTNKALFLVMAFIDLAIVFLVLNILVHTSAKIVGVLLLGVAVCSFYAAAGVLLNTMAGRVVLPLGRALWAPKPAKAETGAVEQLAAA